MGRPKKQPGELGRVVPKFDGAWWRARVIVRDPAGEAVELKARGASEAETLRDIQLQADAVWNGMFVRVDGQLTIAQLSSMWLRENADRVALGALNESSLEVYERTVSTIIVPAIGAVPASAMTVRACNQFIVSMAKISPSRGRKARSALTGILAVGVECGVLPSNPVRDTRRVPAAGTKYFTITDVQFAGIIGLVRQWRGANPDRRGGARPNKQLLEDILVVSLATGIRPNEVLALRRSRIDVTGSDVQVTVDATGKRTASSGLIIQEHAKHRRQHRTLTVPAFGGAVLRRRINAASTDGTDLIFTTRNGTQLPLEHVRRLLRGFRRDSAAGLRALGVNPADLELRALRKVTATVVKDVLGLELAAELLGHSNTSTTSKYYAGPRKTVPSSVARAVQTAFGATTDQV